MNILIVGSGGREHALALALCQSAQVQHVYVAPGNAGTALMHKTSNLELKLTDHDSIGLFCVQSNVGLIVVGPEQPLADGLIDVLEDKYCLVCCGPRADAAKIEASKAFSKQFMQRHTIPTAEFTVARSIQHATAFIESHSEFDGFVVKASGLCSGKGVVVTHNEHEALLAANEMLEHKQFGAACEEIVIEERLTGFEVSVLCLTDGRHIRMLPPAQDHKRLLDGDKGPNTGGMGAYCPCPLLSTEQLEFIEHEILQKTVDCLNMDGIKYTGVLYAGIMVTASGPKVLEFNCRFGDPETQVILPLIESDLVSLLQSCSPLSDLSLRQVPLKISSEKFACGVVLVSEGYPLKYSTQLPIDIDEDLPSNVHLCHAGTSLNGQGDLVTSGGRVLCCVSVSESLVLARKQATNAASQVHFSGAFFRHDIAQSAVQQQMLTYAASGVSIDEGENLIQIIKPICQRTKRAGCPDKSLIGGFAAEFNLAEAGYRNPILMMGTDGVGTKLEVASVSGGWDQIGIDLVAMCANDVLCHGAEPLAFLDYYVTGQLRATTASLVVKGIAEGCLRAGCALVGGETAEMPGTYGREQWDLAGTIIGALENGLHPKLPLLDSMQVGDRLIAFPSSGVHSNGFSLLRHVLTRNKLHMNDPCPWNTQATIASDLLTPTSIYVKDLLPVVRAGHVLALAHITGGGLLDNIPRVLPKGVAVTLDARKWPMHKVFCWLHSNGPISVNEILRTYNCGVGMVAVVNAQCDVPVVFAHMKHYEIGYLHAAVQGEPRVQVLNIEQALQDNIQATISQPNLGHVIKVPIARKRVAVLISGTGSNMKALVQAGQKSVDYEIVLVVSNEPDATGLTLAQNLGVHAQALSHRDYSKRADFETALHELLQEWQVDLVCLAGFMRILGAGFVRKWQGRLLNIHPSLLPAFKGAHAHRDVLQAGVLYTGCTVHFVEPEVDSGPIVAQSVVAVMHDDNEQTLAKRVQAQEHVIYAQALTLVATAQVTLVDGLLHRH